MGDFFEHALDYLDDGGLIMVPLAIAGLGIWYAIGHRLVLLRGKVRERARVLVTAAIQAHAGALARVPAPLLPEARRWVIAQGLARLEDDLGRFRVPLKAFVVAAPLLGLLGTVMGMMETFASLGDGALYVQGGGIAAGVSEALLTTQLGLAVALPGLLIGQLLERRERRLREAIDAIKSIATAEGQ
jgi:biopolymer transport protein ExbB